MSVLVHKIMHFGVFKIALYPCHITEILGFPYWLKCFSEFFAPSKTFKVSQLFFHIIFMNLESGKNLP